jgi:hypothetical protein
VRIRLKYQTGGSATYGFRILTATGDPSKFTARPATASGAVENQPIPESKVVTELDFTPRDGAGRAWGIPIAAGERLALYTSAAELFALANAPGARSQSTSGDHSSGSKTYSVVSKGLGGTEFELMLQGTVEPDADGDRYGDETQDNCPTVANDQSTNPCAASSPPGATSPIAAVIATISGLSQTHPVFRVGLKSTPLLGRTTRSHPRGDTVSFRLSQPAVVTVRIQRKLPGRRVGRVCKRPTRRLRLRPRCTRLVLKATLRRTARAGRNRIAFSGRIRGHALKPGRYRAAFTAANAAGTSALRALSFRIVAR